MSATASNVDGVREVTPEIGARLCAVGRIADLSRENEIVHVGKPVGSISGWVGPIFWQVWSDWSDDAGTVHACIGEGQTETWQFAADLEKPQMLDAAKDRALAAAHAMRQTLLAAAKSDLLTAEARLADA